MSYKENQERITISLDPQLAAWVKQKKADLEAKDRRMKTSVSAIIADAIADMKARDEASTQQPRGQAMPDYMPDYMPNETPTIPQDFAHIVDPTSSGSVGGSSTPKAVNYRKAGKAK